MYFIEFNILFDFHFPCIIIIFLINFLPCLQVIRIRIGTLLGNDDMALVERKKFIKYGQLGDLLFNPNSMESDRRWDKEEISEVFDNDLDRWIAYTPEQIIKTYSMVPKPPNVAIELDYFLRSAPLVKHRYIWADEAFGRTGMPREIVAKLFNNQNLVSIGRYTTHRYLPSIFEPARMVKHGFIEQSQTDYGRLM